MASSDQTPQERLERQLEHALHAGRSKSFLIPQLEKLASMATVGSRAYCFAHRTLAELLVEQAPWRAALHARRVAIACPEDEAAHALLGLAHAILGNYRASIASYRRALTLSPGNPCYAHNIGHLLDVALDKPHDGLAFLRAAHREAPDQADITSSLAHCFARCGARDEALALATSLARSHVHRKDFLELVRWIAVGNLTQPRAAALLAPHLFDADSSANSPSSTDWIAFTRTLIDRSGLEPEQRILALSVLSSNSSLPIHDPITAHAAAAALEYAVCARTPRARTQRALADAYGLSVQSLRRWIALIRPLVGR